MRKIVAVAEMDVRESREALRRLRVLNQEARLAVDRSKERRMGVASVLARVY